MRSPRPPYVFLRVGDVVMESKGHMVGVVVSWDSELRAPQEWVDKVYSNSEVSSSLKILSFLINSGLIYIIIGKYNCHHLYICACRSPKQRIRLIIKCCSAGLDPPLCW